MAQFINIYIDIDGVLTTKLSTPSKHHTGLHFDSMCVENLKKILVDLKQLSERISITVISDWRYDMPNADLVDIFHKVYDFKSLINHIDFTAMLSNREHEIKQHLQENGEISAYVILDDLTYKDKILRQRLLQTRAEDGIRSYEDVKASIMDIIQQQVSL